MPPSALSPIITLHPPLSPSASASAPPDLLILCTWMDAPPKLIRKYMDEYTARFPSCAVLHLTSSLGYMFFSSQKSYDAALRPALPVIASTLEQGGRLVGALYSNGGAHTLTSLADLWAREGSVRGAAKSRDQSTGQNGLPVERLIIDSAPGSAHDLAAGHRAMIVGIPSTIRPVISPLLWLFLYLFWLAVNVFGASNPIARLTDRLVDARLFAPVVGESAQRGARTYIYSGEDMMVAAGAVEASAAASERRGWNVRLERFVGSKHVAHMLADRERYWRLVEETLKLRD